MRYIGLILVLVVLVGCSEYQTVEVNVQESYDIDYFKTKYPNYRDSADVDSLYDFLVNYADTVNDRVVEEILVFDTSGVLVEYVFYYYSVDEANEPSYLMFFADRTLLMSEKGCPMYLSSKYFAEDVFATDSFHVSVRLATPPDFKSEFTVYYVDSTEAYNKRAHHVVTDDHLTIYGGTIKDETHTEETYCIVSRLTQDDFWRYDTICFPIKIKQDN